MKRLSLLTLLIFVCGMFIPSAYAGVSFSLYNVGGSCSGAFFWATHDNTSTTELLARVTIKGANVAESLQKVEAGKVAFFTFTFPAAEPETLIVVSITDGTAPAARHEYTCIPNAGISDPNSDIDGDGLRNVNDNCIFKANPKQEDGWGSLLGDACEEPYDSRNGAKVFPQKDATYHVFGNCKNDACVVVADIDPTQLGNLKAGEFRRFQTSEGEGWFVDVYFVGVTDNGRRFYQVNIYQNGGNLVDDKFTFKI